MTVKFLLEVAGDANDGDYVRELTELTELNEVELPLLHKLVAALKAESGNWPSSEYADGCVEDIYAGYFTEDELDNVQGWIPYGEYGIHTVKDITVYEFIGKTELL